MYKKYTSNAEIISEAVAKQKAIDESYQPKRYSPVHANNSSKIDTMLENKIIHEDNIAGFRQFKNDVPTTLMSLAIGAVYDEVLESCGAEEEDYPIGYSVINKFVEESGYDNLVRRFAKKNILLSEMARYCEIYKDIIIDEASEGIKKCMKMGDQDLCYTMNQDLAQDFVNKIKDMVPGRTISIIRSRVADSMEDFVNRNAENKAAIVDIYTKANMATQDSSNDDAVQEDIKILAKNEASKVYDKPTNVFGAIVRSLSESIMKNPEIRDQYLTEDNHLDMKRIVNESSVIYTVLEELNSLQMVDVDKNYIKNMINSIS